MGNVGVRTNIRISIRLLTGSHESLIRLHMKSEISRAAESGKTVFVDPAEIQGDSLFFEDTSESLYVFTDPGKFPDGFWKNLRNQSSGDSYLLVHFGTMKKSHIWSEIPGVKPEIMEAPKSYEADSKAVDFLRMLSKANQRILSDNLAHLIVEHAGNDFGVLAWEWWKLMLITSAGQAVSLPDIRGAIASFQSPEGDKLVNAIALGDTADIVRIMDRIESGSTSDPTMAITLSVLQPTFLRWFVCLRVPKNSLASVLGGNPWFVENKILPLATKVGEGRLKALIKAISDAHIAVSEGARDPWVVLKSGILRAIRVQ